MPPKNPKITDVASPGKTAPSASGRPIIVTNRPVLPHDPMIADPAKETAPTDPALVRRSAKVIAPVSPDMAAASPMPQPETPSTDDMQALVAATLPVDKPAPVAPAQASEVSTPATGPAAQTGIVPAEQEPSAPAPQAASAPRPDKASELRDVEAENVSAEDETAAAQAEADAAQTARAQELEQIIESGVYAVPINAVQRKRSRMFIAAMCVVAALLGLVLADAVLDANLVHPPFAVPHTHLFSGN